MKRLRYYHPITAAITLLVCLAAVGGPALAADDVGVPRPTYATSFVPGTRVVLLDNELAGTPELKAGMSGIIICCDRSDCSGRVLVSWDLWRGGRNEEAECAGAPIGLYPTGSTMWVDPSKVRLGLPFDAAGILKEASEGCLYLSTAEGGLFHLVVGPGVQKQWFVIHPGSSFRVRGLLDTSRPATEPACAQADGDVFHPIFAPTDWGTGVDSWDRGPFHAGDRVVLIGESNPNQATDLTRGATGTIICRNTLGVEHSILVSWDLWEQGLDPEEYLQCTERFTGAYPLRSTWWVSPKDIAKYYESKCGTLEETVLCARGDTPEVPVVGLFVPLDNVYCLPDIDLGLSLPTGLVKAVGLFTPYEELMGRQTPTDPDLRDTGGVIFDSVVIACHIPSACTPAYAAGDRVRLLVNEPGGAKGLAAGTGGVVMCSNPQDPIAPILVSWDFWTGGNDDSAACQEPAGWFPDKSGWWMACSEIKRAILPDLYDRAEFRRFLPETVQVGKHLKISGEIANAGGATSGSFVVNIYLSTDAEITSSDYLLTQVGMDIQAGASQELSWLNPVPEAVAPGTYYVGWIIDPDNRVAEEDENNNVAVVNGQLTVTGK